MTHITASVVQQLAALSAISLDDNEIESMRQELGKIFEYIAQLQELDTSAVEPTYQVGWVGTAMRSDEVAESLGREKLLSLAPSAKDNQIKVPKVL
jgi:aspartyl-tRNA(Asn)/glutamyl-tRNA(Gln) amidotransferase subunit C